MRYYPLFIDLSKIHCLVLGAGKVGRRKIASLLKANARTIFVLDAELTKKDFETRFQEEYTIIPCVSYEKRNFCENDLKQIRLAFAATACTKTNGFLAQLCEEKQIFCNVIEEVSRGDFLVPSHLDYDNLIVALSTSGTSPAFAKVLKEDLANWLDVGYAPFLRLMEQIRSYLVNSPTEFQTIERRTEVFRALVKAEYREQILHHIQKKNKKDLEILLKHVLPSLKGDIINWEVILEKNSK